ncbi:MAG: hypothetical protein ABIJ41_04945 [Candidatus Omnitrophota bacterium]
MGYSEWMDEKIKKMSCWDVGVLKICLIAFALMVAKLWPIVLNLSWFWYGAIFGVTYAYLIYKIYLKK